MSSVPFLSAPLLSETSVQLPLLSAAVSLPAQSPIAAVSAPVHSLPAAFVSEYSDSFPPAVRSPAADALPVFPVQMPHLPADGLPGLDLQQTAPLYHGLLSLFFLPGHELPFHSEPAAEVSFWLPDWLHSEDATPE